MGIRRGPDLSLPFAQIRFPGTALLLAFLLLACRTPAAGAEEPQARPPNVVIFFTDDQGVLDAGCYGSTDLYTPTIDRLAEQGIRFTQAYAHTVCCPARAMLMTGRYPQRSGITGWTQANAHARKGRNMPLDEITIAEALKKKGFNTALFGKWHLGAHPDHQPVLQGFDQFYGILGGFIDNYNHHALHGKGFHDLYDGKREIFLPGQYFPDLMVDKALNFIDQNRNNPFLLIVSFNIPHYPEQADPKFDERYKDLPMPRQAYAKIVSTTDDRMGRVMKRLDSHKLTENTIVIFMADNGYSVEDYAIRVDNHRSGLPKGHNYGANGGGGNAGKWRGHKGTFFEGGVRVPAIISYPPRIPRGEVRDQAITVMDWLPTVAGLCGAPLPKRDLDGNDLMPLIADKDALSPYETIHWEWRDNWGGPQRRLETDRLGR